MLHLKIESLPVKIADDGSSSHRRRCRSNLVQLLIRMMAIRVVTYARDMQHRERPHVESFKREINYKAEKISILRRDPVAGLC